MGIEDDQWLSRVEEKEKQMKALLKKAENEDTLTEAIAVRPFENYIGEFENPGYGTVKISLDQDALMASHNEIAYALKHKCYDHFTVSAKLRRLKSLIAPLSPMHQAKYQNFKLLQNLYYLPLSLNERQQLELP